MTLLASASPLLRVVLQPTVLTITAGGKIDLSDNELIAPATAAVIRSQLSPGTLFTSHGGGALGYLDVGGGKTDVQFTLAGDTNLDGTVDVTDLGNLASSYGTASGMLWINGDSDYNGTTNVTDLGSMASNYGATLGGGVMLEAEPIVLVAAPMAQLAAPMSTNAASEAASVPEPAWFGLVGLIAAWGLKRCRRR